MYSFFFFLVLAQNPKTWDLFFSIFLSPPLRLFLFFPFSSISNILRFSAFLIHYPFLLFPFFPLNCMPLLLFKNVSIENNIRFSDRKINDRDIWLLPAAKVSVDSRAFPFLYITLSYAAQKKMIVERVGGGGVGGSVWEFILFNNFRKDSTVKSITFSWV